MPYEMYNEDILRFFLSLVFYIPSSVLGALISSYIRSLSNPGEMKIIKHRRSVFSPAIVSILSGLVPAFLLGALDEMISKLVPMVSLRIGIAFIVGCMGEEILIILSSTNQIINVLKSLGNHIENVKAIADTAGEVFAEISHTAENEQNPGGSNNQTEDETSDNNIS